MRMKRVTLDKITEVFESDMFDNDVHDKVAYLQYELGCKKSSSELLEIYDNLD
jgi:hypothetical protein